MPNEAFKRLPIFQGMTPAEHDLLKPLFIPCDFYDQTVILNKEKRLNFYTWWLTGKLWYLISRMMVLQLPLRAFFREE
jgi:hypothetical protein